VREMASGLAVFVLLCSSAALGILVRPRLPEHHRTRETMELMQITIGLLVRRPCAGAPHRISQASLR
jgi:hypothetical protein